MDNKYCPEGDFWLPEEFFGDNLLLHSGGGDSIMEPTTVAAESDDEDNQDDYMVALTLQMGRYILQDVDDDMDAAAAAAAASYGREESMAQSPQSTLSPWSPSSNGSPDGPSLASSPATSPPLVWRGKGSCPPRFSPRRRARHPRPPAPKAHGGVHGFQQRLPRAAHFGSRQTQVARASSLSLEAAASASGQLTAGATLDLSPSAWPPLGQPPPPKAQTQRSGMRVVPRNNVSVPQRECAGTGVFLPRVCGTCGGFILNGESCATSPQT